MSNITYHNNIVSSDDRRKNTSTKGCVVWLTGLSGSGKSTLGTLLEKKLIDNGYCAYLLDGDNLRFGLNAGLGFSEQDREENIRRIAECAKIIADSGQVAIVSAISPMRSMRDNARNIISCVSDFIEVFVDTPVEVCAGRDVKGLYKKAYSGEIKNFTGVSAPYEAPLNAEIVIRYDKNVSAQMSCDMLYSRIVSGFIDYRHILEVMKNTAVCAGEKILEIYNSNDFDIQIKSDNSPLTKADTASNDIICEALQKEFPYIDILSEEKADDEKRYRNRYCFVVDPLDGTKEFIKRNGEFTVNIALVDNHRPVAGVIYQPVTGELYYALKDVGAFKDYNGNTVKLSVSDRTEDITVIQSRSHITNESELFNEQYNKKIKNVVSAGSSLKGCRIAQGLADVYYRTGPTMEWDTCAMQIIVEQAGGIFRMLDGYDSEMLYNRTHLRNDQGFYCINRIENKA